MRIVLLLGCLAFVLNAFSQTIVSKQTSVPLEIENRIRKEVEDDILLYRAKMSPIYDFEKLAPKRTNEGEILYYKNLRELLFNDRGIRMPDDYKMLMDIQRWPEDSPYLNYYLVIKKGMRFSNGRDTIAVDVFNQLFDRYDERYLIYYKPDSIPPFYGVYKNVSGSFFLDGIFKNWFDYGDKTLLSKLVYTRLARYNASQGVPFPDSERSDTNGYSQFKVSHSLLTPKALLVKIIKPYPYDVLELSYFTNDTTITKGDIRELYEIKYVIDTDIDKYEQTLPQINLVKNGWEFFAEKYKNEDRQWYDFLYTIQIPSPIDNKEVRVNGKITSVQVTDEGIVILLKKGDKIVLPNLENTRYVISDKSKHKITVTEKGTIVHD